MNVIRGGSVSLARHWDAFVEYGFNGKDVQAVSARLMFRF